MVNVCRPLTLCVILASQHYIFITLGLILFQYLEAPRKNPISLKMEHLSKVLYGSVCFQWINLTWK